MSLLYCRFAPAASDDIVVHDPQQSRCALLQGYTIFLLNGSDQQYLNIGTACGATMVQCVSKCITHSFVYLLYDNSLRLFTC